MLSYPQDPVAGIIPRAVSELFKELIEQKADFTVRISLFETYGDLVFDLLSPMDSPPVCWYDSIQF